MLFNYPFMLCSCTAGLPLLAKCSDEPSGPKKIESFTFRFSDALVKLQVADHIEVLPGSATHMQLGSVSGLHSTDAPPLD